MPVFVLRRLEPVGSKEWTHRFLQLFLAGHSLQPLPMGPLSVCHWPLTPATAFQEVVKTDAPSVKDSLLLPMRLLIID